MKNTLVFLCADGIGLNSAWKGNCLKLADKPNINHLISGIYPWTILMNSKKVSKLNSKKKYNCVSTDIDKNFYQMICGDKDAKTINERIDELVNNKTFSSLKIFSDIAHHAKISKSRYVHVFYMLSNNKSHFTIENFKFILNVLLKNNLIPLLHLIADGKEDEQFSFEKHLSEIDAFLKNRNIQIATIVGRDNAFIQNGRDYTFNENIKEYYYTICGIGYNKFKYAKDYANENLYLKTKDYEILPGYNSNIEKYFLEKNDSVLFLDSDPDVFSPLLHLIKNDDKLKGIFISSSNEIYGNILDSIMFKNNIDQSKIISNVIANNNMNSLILGLNHKKGFINKFYGDKRNDSKVVRKIIKTDYIQSDIDYIFSANKLLIDAAIKNIGSYDYICIHIPTIAEIAFKGDLKLLKFAIENLDKNIGRLINFIKSTGNVIAFSSAFGACEKMMNKKLDIIPYKKNSIVPFVFTNGDLSTKKLNSDFYGLYSTLLIGVGARDVDKRVPYNSLITSSYNKDNIHTKLIDQYNVWKEEIADPLIADFEDNNLSLYNDMNKNSSYLFKKQQYVVLKEIINLHNQVFTTPDARKMLFDKIYKHVKFNGIDFLNFNYNYQKTLMTLFNDEIKLSRLSSFANRFFDNCLWKTQIKRNDKWFKKTKLEISSIIDRTVSINDIKSAARNIEQRIEPYQFFMRLMNTEIEILKTNDAHKIVEFYDSIRYDVENVYERYFKNKIEIVENDELDFSSKADQNNYDDVPQEKNPEYEKIAAYYESFLEVLKLIDSNRGKINIFNLRYKENIEKLKYEVVIKDIFNAKPYELNYLSKEIVYIYGNLNRTNSIIDKSYLRDISRIATKYDLKYNKKVLLKKELVWNENEFLEGVDLNAQYFLENVLNEKVKKLGCFDDQTIDNDTNVEESNVDFDLDVDPFYGYINKSSEYDKTDIWNKKRNEEKINFDKLSDISIDAEKAVIEDRKVREVKKRIDNYVDLNKIWKEKQNQIKNNN